MRGKGLFDRLDQMIRGDWGLPVSWSLKSEGVKYSHEFCGTGILE
jgi:hypothetical protein